MEFRKLQSNGSLPLVVALLCLTSLGCGAPPSPAPPAPPQIAVTRDVEERVLPSEAPELAKVDALLYLKNPEAIMQAIAKLLQPEGAEPIAPLDVKALFEDRLGPELTRVVDLTQPMQVAYLHEEALHDSPNAYSLGLLSSSATKPLDVEVGRQCVRQTAPSDRPRLVCSEAGPVTDGVLALFDQAAQRAFAGDVLVELPQDAFRRAAAEREAEDVPEAGSSAFHPYEGPLPLLGETFAKEFLDGLGTLSFELSLGHSRAELAVELEVRQTSGFLATLLVGDAPTAQPPEFTGLPADANLGVTLSGLESSGLQKATEPVWREFEADLVRYHPRAQIAAIVAELRQLVLTGGPLLFASGPPRPAQARVAPQNKDPQAERLALQGWWSVGVNEPLERWARGLERLIDLDQKQFPLAEGEPQKELRAPRPTVTILRKYPVPGNAGLPKGSFHFRVWNTRNPDYVLADGEQPPLETTTYVYVTGRPPTTWIVASEHDRLALLKAKELVLARDTNTRAGFFRPPATERTRLLGFTTLKALAMHLVPAESQLTVQGVLDIFGSGSESIEFPLRYSVARRGASQYARLSVGVPSEVLASLSSIVLPLSLLRFGAPAPGAPAP